MLVFGWCFVKIWDFDRIWFDGIDFINLIWLRKGIWVVLIDMLWYDLMILLIKEDGMFYDVGVGWVFCCFEGYVVFFRWGFLWWIVVVFLVFIFIVFNCNGKFLWVFNIVFGFEYSF